MQIMTVIITESAIKKSIRVVVLTTTSETNATKPVVSLFANIVLHVLYDGSLN